MFEFAVLYAAESVPRVLWEAVIRNKLNYRELREIPLSDIKCSSLSVVCALSVDMCAAFEQSTQWVQVRFAAWPGRVLITVTCERG